MRQALHALRAWVFANYDILTGDEGGREDPYSVMDVPIPHQHVSIRQGHEWYFSNGMSVRRLYIRFLRDDSVRYMWRTLGMRLGSEDFIHPLAIFAMHIAKALQLGDVPVHERHERDAGLPVTMTLRNVHTLPHMRLPTDETFYSTSEAATRHRNVWMTHKYGDPVRWIAFCGLHMGSRADVVCPICSRRKTLHFRTPVCKNPSMDWMDRLQVLRCEECGVYVNAFHPLSRLFPE